MTALIIAALTNQDGHYVTDDVLAGILLVIIGAAWTALRAYRKRRNDRLTAIEDTLEVHGKLLKRLFPNGRNTEDPGDLIALIAEHLGIIPKKDHHEETS